MEEATIDEAVWSSVIEGAFTSKAEAARIIRQNKSPSNKSEQMVKNNYQALLYLARRGARGWLYGNGEIYTAVCGKGEITFPARADGILSVFCLGELAAGVTIRGAHYSVENAVLTPDFPLGCSNHFIGRPITVSVERGDLLLGLHEVEE